MSQLVISNYKGKVIQKDNLEFREGDTLIVQFDDLSSYEKFMWMTNNERKKIINQYRQLLMNPGGVIVLPPGISLKVLSAKPALTVPGKRIVNIGG